MNALSEHWFQDRLVHLGTPKKLKNSHLRVVINISVDNSRLSQEIFFTYLNIWKSFLLKTIRYLYQNIIFNLIFEPPLSTNV